MGRIDDALRQAGKQSAPLTPDPQESLNAFATSSDVAIAEPVTTAPIEAVAPLRTPPSTSPFVNGPRLILHKDTEPVVVEQYRRLAAVLHHAQVDRGVKVVMLASAQASEGKTLTAANIALTLSESYRRRVLLIDADLRRPSIGSIFGVSAPSGLSECLKSHDLQTLRVTHVTESLGLLLAGTADNDPMAGLTSGRMQEIIEQASQSFDWVLIDTPPIGLLTDAHLLGAMVDAAVFVINAGTTQHSAIQRALDSVGREKVVGVVLNRVETSALAEASYYDYYRDSRRTQPQEQRSGHRVPDDIPERAG